MEKAFAPLISDMHFDKDWKGDTGHLPENDNNMTLLRKNGP